MTVILFTGASLSAAAQDDPWRRHIEAAQAAASRGDNGRALDAYKRALVAAVDAPGRAETHLAMADLLASMSDARAEPAYRAAISEGASASQGGRAFEVRLLAHNNLGSFLLAANRARDAVRLLQPLADEGDERDPILRARYFYTYGRAIENSGDEAGALQRYLQAGRLDDEFITAWSAARELSLSTASAAAGLAAAVEVVNWLNDLGDRMLLSEYLKAALGRRDWGQDPAYARLQVAFVDVLARQRIGPDAFEQQWRAFLGSTRDAVSDQAAARFDQLTALYIANLPVVLDPTAAPAQVDAWTGGRDELSRALEVMADEYLRTGDARRALQRYALAWTLAPSRPEGLLSAADLLRHAPQTLDPDGKFLRQIAPLASEATLGAEAAMRLHVTLAATIEERSEPESLSGAQEALVHWEQALLLREQLAAGRAGGLGPAPVLFERAGRAYAAVGDDRNAAPLLVASARAYLNAGETNAVLRVESLYYGLEYRGTAEEQRYMAEVMSVSRAYAENQAARPEAIVVTAERPVLLERVPIGTPELWTTLASTVPVPTADRGTIGRPQIAPSRSALLVDGVAVANADATSTFTFDVDYQSLDDMRASASSFQVDSSVGPSGAIVFKPVQNVLHVSLRGVYSGDNLQSANVPSELEARGVTRDVADRTEHASEVSADAGLPVLPDRAWLWASIGKQELATFRAATGVLDQSFEKSYSIKGTGRPTMSVGFDGLWFVRETERSGQPTGATLREAPSATWRRSDLFPRGRPRGLVSSGINWVLTDTWVAKGKYSYYGTGASLQPTGGMHGQAATSVRLGETFGSTRSIDVRGPQHTVSGDVTYLFSGLGGSHTLRLGGVWRRTDAFVETTWPGNMVVARDESLADRRARLYRASAGANRIQHGGVYIADELRRESLTLNLGVRYDDQRGRALPGVAGPNAAFPNLLPGVQFSGYELPATWRNVTPRLGAAYQFFGDRMTVLRAGFSSHAGSLDAETVGFANSAGAAAFVEYAWIDLNGDLFAQSEEVQVGPGPIAFGGGFNPADPRAQTSANTIHPALRAPLTHTLSFEVDRELTRNLAVQGTYVFSRATRFAFAPWRGLVVADYAPGAQVVGQLPDGTLHVQTYVPIAARVAVGGNGRVLMNHPGFHTDAQTVGASVRRRFQNRWSMSASATLTTRRGHYDGALIDSRGNPTPLDGSDFPFGVLDALVEGGEVSPFASGNFLNSRWQVNATGEYQLPWNLRLYAVFSGREGQPYPFFQPAPLGLDGSLPVLVTPALDTVRFDNHWMLDLRLMKERRWSHFSAVLTADVLNVLNSSTELNRERNIASPNFGRLNRNLSPRILHVGVRIGFDTPWPPPR